MTQMVEKKEIPAVTEHDMFQIILDAELQLSSKGKRYWERIRIHPQKWIEKKFGKGCGGFWVVGILGNNIIWYNELEDGFIISEYESFGTISTYNSAEQKLSFLIEQIIRKFEGEFQYSK